MMPLQSPPCAPREPHAFWRALAYRWFVEYNPLYLVSAALVLGGCSLLARGLTRETDVAPALAVGGVAEIYALALLGGIAMLTRIGQRRPAIMLTLLFVLYQWDLTLHDETCAYLGGAGAIAAAAWCAIAIGKALALAWALRVRFPRAIVAAASIAAIGLAAGPRIVPALGGAGAGAAVALWAFALATIAQVAPEIMSDETLTAWGQTVLRRTTRAAWALSAILIGMHVLLWRRDHAIALEALLPVVPLLFVRRAATEARAWGIALATLAFAAVLTPIAFAPAALIVAAAFVMRASWTRGDAGARGLAGAAFAMYLAVWTAGWSGGAWPAHVLVLDAGLTLVVLGLMRALRVRSPLLPLALCHAHWIAKAHVVPAPRTTMQWGTSAVALGFVLLAVSLATSYRLRHGPDR